jgi:predicted MarR family transcription regulator
MARRRPPERGLEKGDVLAIPPRAALGPVVSSAHLAAGQMPALSEIEFGLILLGHAFERWMVRCAAAAGVPGLNAFDVLILHNVNHRGRSKRLADICLMLNIEDTHLVIYSLKKLTSLGLVNSSRVGKEKAVSITAKGEVVCRRYKDVREALLVRAVKASGFAEDRMSEIAGWMRALSGHYDQAARAAVSI